MTEKSELEKRWEAEAAEEAKEAEHECCGNCATAEGCANAESEEDAELTYMQQTFIPCPLVDHFSPMVMIISDNKFYMGGVEEVASDSITMVFPMEYQEILYRDPQNPQAVGLQVEVKPVLNSLGIVDDMRFNHTMLYFLKLNKAEDERLVSTYEEAITHSRASSANIAVPSLDDIKKANSPIIS